ncbi:DUF4325 domain-containing protein [Candidatus Accumulibacter sp. ACC003]|uniref:STAS-like domain-containing protein n=1 Tax=Candidatus Accumulibacter sp. ACC003 TaxID=2823334 RepID=UPI0025BF76AB|nr:DUF4325 domain-containing protein [Candidatus Accumulibacter sp. ACC003]
MDIVDKLILKIIASGEPHVASAAAGRLGLSRQTIAARLRRLADAQLIEGSGRGRGRCYALVPILSVSKARPREGIDEFRVWQEDVAPLLADLPENVVDICRYGVTEMVNNAVDHSEGSEVIVRLQRTALTTTIRVSDDGEGIFHRLQRLLGFYDPREAILELAKGKLTTDPERHSGEGVFFTSRVFDRFSILSRNLFFSHDSDRDDWLIDVDDDSPGTFVTMELANDSKRTTKEIFDQFAEPDEYSFAKTVVPVRLAQHEGEKLVSRSQARRLAQRFDKFKTVVLDFTAVEAIGQAFADEIFRVFASSHPGLVLIPINMTEHVREMISRATSKS